MSTVVADSGTWLIFLGGLTHSIARHVAFEWLWRQRLENFVKVGYVSGLLYYPLKSCRGVELRNAVATGLGLSHDGVSDRHWMIVDKKQAFVNQCKEPRVVLITVNTMGKESSVIKFEAPGMGPLLLPKSLRVNQSSKTMKCRVFRHWVNTLDCGDLAAEWVCSFLKRSDVRLVCVSEDLEMAELSTFSEDPEEAVLPGDEVAFADFASYLIVSQTSVDYVNGRLNQPVNVLNYRPNIVIGGCKDPFEEEQWLEVWIGGFSSPDSIFRCLHLCSRCVITTVDRDKGVKDPDMQPLKTLKSIRGVSKNRSPKFGVYATLNKKFDIKIGDPVYALFR